MEWNFFQYRISMVKKISSRNIIILASFFKVDFFYNFTQKITKNIKIRKKKTYVSNSYTFKKQYILSRFLYTYMYPSIILKIQSVFYSRFGKTIIFIEKKMPLLYFYFCYMAKNRDSWTGDSSYMEVYLEWYG